MLDDHSKLEPPDPIPNSEVKRLSADGSVGLPHVRVGHRQASNSKSLSDNWQGFFTISTTLLICIRCAGENLENKSKEKACSRVDDAYNARPTVEPKR